MFKHQGLQPVLSESPYEALHVCSRQTFLMVCATRHLPYMDGDELLDKITKDKPLDLVIDLLEPQLRGLMRDLEQALEEARSWDHTIDCFLRSHRETPK